MLSIAATFLNLFITMIEFGFYEQRLKVKQQNIKLC